MPYRDRDAHNTYQRNYRADKAYQAGREPRKAGRPPIEDRKILLSLRLRSSLVGRVQRILLEGLATGAYPYKTTSHAYEDLVIRGLETLKGHDTVDEALQYLRAVQPTDNIGNHRKEAQASFARVSIEITELLQIKAEDQARHYYWAIRRSFEEMSANVWRDWFLSEIELKFPRLHAKPPKGGVALGEDGEKRPPQGRSKLKAVK